MAQLETAETIIKKLKEDSPELFTGIQAIADKNQITIISFVAPSKTVRVSPKTVAWAEIREYEMFELEKYVKSALSNQLINKDNATLHLILHTPGGQLHTSYKIAYFLRKKFKNIQAYVPYEAASGGTMICCAANNIILGELGNLTPIDPQIPYEDNYVSAYAFERAITDINDDYGELTLEEIPSPYQQMARKFDPILSDEYSTLVNTTTAYADNLLELSGFTEKEAWLMAYRLARPLRSHAYPYFKEDLVKRGFKVLEDKENYLDLYGQLVSKCLEKAFANHIIIPFYPQPHKEDKPVDPSASNV